MLGLQRRVERVATAFAPTIPNAIPITTLAIPATPRRTQPRLAPSAAVTAAMTELQNLGRPCTSRIAMTAPAVTPMKAENAAQNGVAPGESQRRSNRER